MRKASRRATEAIEGSGLSARIRGVVLEVVGSTRLWEREQLDVARELTAHFLDGLERGATEDELLESFGEPRQLAGLIRRGKIRGRSMGWWAMRRTGQGLAALLALLVLAYAWSAARFHFDQPRIARDYLAELNEPARGIPEQDRAWPMYRRAVLMLPALPEELERSWPPEGPESPAWAAAMEYLGACAPAIELVHAGAAAPALGVEVSRLPDQELAAHAARLKGQAPPPPAVVADEGPVLYSVLLPHLGELRKLSRLLLFEARAASAAGEGRRFEAAIDSITSVAEHSREQPLLIAQLVSLAIHASANEEVGRMLRDNPGLLDDAALVRLAHRLGAPMFTIRFDTERMGFDDFMQHAYSDDGRGGGRLTAKGLRSFEGVGVELSPGTAVLGPAMAMIAADRRATSDLYHRMMDRMQTQVGRPLWEWENLDFEGDLERLGGPLARQRHYFTFLLIPALERSGVAAAQTSQVRDATVTAIALELYRRRHGEWPSSLGELTPSFLPTVPRDQFTGGPIGYVLGETGPVIYSVGADRKDDGGRAVDGIARNASEWIPLSRVAEQLLKRNPRDNIDGDWLLWPRPRANRADE